MGRNLGNNAGQNRGSNFEETSRERLRGNIEEMRKGAMLGQHSENHKRTKLRKPGGGNIEAIHCTTKEDQSFPSRQSPVPFHQSCVQYSSVDPSTSILTGGTLENFPSNFTLVDISLRAWKDLLPSTFSQDLKFVCKFQRKSTSTETQPTLLPSHFSKFIFLSRSQPIHN